MPHVTIGLRVGCLPLPLREALSRAAAMGAEAVQLEAVGDLSPERLTRTGQRDLRHHLKQLGLELAALGFPTHVGYDTDEGLDQRVLATQAVMSLAYPLGARVVTNRVGLLPSDDSHAAWSLLRESMEALSAHGDRVGVVFAAEIGANDPERTKAFLGRFDTPGLGVSYDPGSVLLHGGDPLAGVVALGDAVVHSHARDVRRDSRTGDMTEAVPGAGDVDWAAYLAALEEIGYRGSVTIDRSGSALGVAQAGEAVAFLKRQRSA